MKNLTILFLLVMTACGIPNLAVEDENGCMKKYYKRYIIYECDSLHTIYYIEDRHRDTLWIAK